MPVWKAAVFILSAALVASLLGHFAGLRSTRIQLALEDASAVEPPSRTVPLEEGRQLACWTFPMRSYDGELQRCVVCEERSTDGRPHPLNLACGR